MCSKSQLHILMEKLNVVRFMFLSDFALKSIVYRIIFGQVSIYTLVCMIKHGQPYTAS